MASSVAMRVRGGRNPSTQDFEMCRTIGHAWDQYYPVGYDRPDYGWRLDLRCLRCTTERHSVISHITGELIGNHQYVWPEGYSIEKGEDRPTRDQLRAHLYVRISRELRMNNAVALAVVEANGVKRRRRTTTRR